MEPREYERSFALEDRHWWFRAKRRLVASLLARHGWRGGRGLDVGCGTGGMLAALDRCGAWIGIDLAPAALAFCRRRGLPRLAAAEGDRLPFRDRTFEACLCLDVLYHRAVASDALVLAECHRVLQDGGLLVVTDSAFAWLRSAHDEAVHGARRYRRPQLIGLAKAAGFTPLAASYACGLVFPALVLVRLLRRRRRPGGPAASDVVSVATPLNRLLLGVQWVERGLLRLGPLPFGSSVVLVARKAGSPAR